MDQGNKSAFQAEKHDCTMRMTRFTQQPGPNLEKWAKNNSLYSKLI